MLIIGNRKYEKQIDSINESLKTLNHWFRQYENFYDRSNLKTAKSSCKKIIRTIETIERAYKREKEKKKK